MRAAERKSARDVRHSSRRRGAQLRLALVAAGVIVVLVACGALYQSSLCTITRVEVVGVTHLSVDAVRALAKVPPDATLIRFPAQAVASRVASDPWVAAVSVSRVFPDGMRIRITERVPVAVVVSRPASWLIDGTGFVVARAAKGATATMPAIMDVPGLDLKAGRRTASEPLLNAVKVLSGLSDTLRAMVLTVSAPSIDGTTLLTKDRVEIVIGEAVSLPTKDVLALKILREQRGKVVSIDVRTIDAPTWRGLK